MAPTKKKCIVPYCNNIEDTCNKQFFKATSLSQKEKWFNALGQKLTGWKNMVMLCCEDHFDLPIAAENYIRYKYLPGVKLKLRSDALPHKNIPNNVCRLCLRVISLNEEFVNITEKNQQHISEIFKVCLSEIDLNLTSDPVFCVKCYKSLETFYNVKLKALKTEVTVVKCVKDVINKKPEKLVKGTCIDLLENYAELQEISGCHDSRENETKTVENKKEPVKNEITDRIENNCVPITTVDNNVYNNSNNISSLMPIIYNENDII